MTGDRGGQNFPAPFSGNLPQWLALQFLFKIVHVQAPPVSSFPHKWDAAARAICLNPIRAKLLPPEEPLQAYRWSSYPEYLKRAGQRVGWLRVDRVLGELGIQRDNTAGRRLFAQAMEERRGKDKPGEWKAVQRGWFLGGAQLREQVLEMMGVEMGEHHGGKEKQETDEQKAQRLVLEELAKRGWTEQDLKQCRKTDARKVKMAARLRRETVMTLDWIARRLQMGCRHGIRWPIV